MREDPRLRKIGENSRRKNTSSVLYDLYPSNLPSIPHNTHPPPNPLTITRGVQTLCMCDKVEDVWEEEKRKGEKEGYKVFLGTLPIPGRVVTF